MRVITDIRKVVYQSGDGQDEQLQVKYANVVISADVWGRNITTRLRNETDWEDVRNEED